MLKHNQCCQCHRNLRSWKTSVAIDLVKEELVSRIQVVVDAKSIYLGD